MVESLHRTEVRYMRAQTVIAGVNMVATAMLTAAGIWIAREVSISADHQRQFERRQDEARVTQRERSDLINSCLSLKLNQIAQKPHSDEDKLAMERISSVIAARCKAGGVNLDITQRDIAGKEYRDLAERNPLAAMLIFALVDAERKSPPQTERASK